jgi:hypothetical protein
MFRRPYSRWCPYLPVAECGRKGFTRLRDFRRPVIMLLAGLSVLVKNANGAPPPATPARWRGGVVAGNPRHRQSPSAEIEVEAAPSDLSVLRHLARIPADPTEMEGERRPEQDSNLRPTA